MDYEQADGGILNLFKKHLHPLPQNSVLVWGLESTGPFSRVPCALKHYITRVTCRAEREPVCAHYFSIHVPSLTTTLPLCHGACNVQIKLIWCTKNLELMQASCALKSGAGNRVLTTTACRRAAGSRVVATDYPNSG